MATYPLSGSSPSTRDLGRESYSGRLYGDSIYRSEHLREVWRLQSEADRSHLNHEFALLRKDVEIFYLRLTLRLGAMILLFGAVLIVGILANQAGQRARQDAPARLGPPIAHVSSIDLRIS